MTEIATDPSAWGKLLQKAVDEGIDNNPGGKWNLSKKQLCIQENDLQVLVDDDKLSAESAKIIKEKGEKDGSRYKIWVPDEEFWNIINNLSAIGVGLSLGLMTCVILS